MDNSIILHNLTRDELFSEISKIVSQALDSKLKPEAPITYLTKKEAAARLRLSLPTLSRLTANGTLHGLRVGRRVLFIANEIDQALKSIETLKYKRN